MPWGLPLSVRIYENRKQVPLISCHSFRNNAVRLQLHALAYNLGNFLRTLALPQKVEHWSLTTLREKLINIGANGATSL